MGVKTPAAVPIFDAALPIGVQLIAAPWREDLCLRAAYALLPVASKQARGVLELFGLRGAFDVGRVYWGALVKSNNPVDRAERIYVRNMATGLLEDMTAELVRKTKTAGLTEALEAVEKRGEEAPRARRRGNPAADRQAGEGVGYEPS